MADITYDNFRRFNLMERWFRQTPEQMLRTPNHPSIWGDLCMHHDERGEAAFRFNSQSNVIGGYMTRDLYMPRTAQESEDLESYLEGFKAFDEVWNHGKSIVERLEPTRTIDLDKVLSEYEG